jgi:tRNA(Ile)-lysidine synthase
VSAPTLDQLSFPPPGAASAIFGLVRQFAQYKLKIQRTKVVVAVSGGADSTALLLLLSPLRSERDLRVELVVGHFDHQLRPAREAKADRAYIEGLSSRLGVPTVFGTGDVRKRAKGNGESIEEAARNLRYEFLRSVAADEGASMVAVGHTADDQVETILHRIIRGTGIEGLAGMKPRREWPFGDGPQLIRPLLCISRRDTEEYCRVFHLRPREDATNQQLGATRNRIRKKVLLALREINPEVNAALLRLGAIASEHLAYLDRSVADKWATVVKSEDPQCISFDRGALFSVDRAVAARCVQRAVYTVGGADLSGLQITQIVDHLSGNSNNSWGIDLPGGVRVKIAKRTLVVHRTEATVTEALSEVDLALPGKVRVGDWTLGAELIESPGKPLNDPLVATIDADAVQGALVVRSRRPGDRLRPLGLGGEKKLQDIFVDAKVPREERDGVPIVADERGVVWVVGHCIDERLAVTAKTRRVIQLRARRMRVDGSGRAR